MAAGAGYYDANGVYRYGETDNIGTLFSDFMNVAPISVSTQLTADRSRLTTLESTATTLTTAARPVNLVINGAFAINQRAYPSGTAKASGAYLVDRWKSMFTNTSLTFTAAPQGQAVTISTSGIIRQIVEQANVVAGSHTLSWTGTATGRVYKSGGTVPAFAASPITVSLDGLADVIVEFTAVSTTKTVSNVMLQKGSSATPFVTAGGNISGELAECQRYYYRMSASAGGIYPMDPSSRMWLNQCTHCRVASSTDSLVFQGPRR